MTASTRHIVAMVFCIAGLSTACDCGTRGKAPQPPDAGSMAPDDAGGVDAATGTSDAAMDASDAASLAEAMCEAKRRPSVGSCVTSTSLDDAGAGVGWDFPEVEMTATVLEIAHGPWDCYGLGTDAYPELGQRPWRFRLDDGTQEVWVGVVLPWSTPLVSVGDTVSVTYTFSDEEFGPTTGTLWIRSADGTTVLWHSQETLTETLSPPLVTVSDADDPCSFDDGCSRVSRAGFELRSDADEVTLPYGGQADFGPYVALHLGNDHQGQATGGCLDYYRSESALMLVRGTSEALAAGEPPRCANDSCRNLACEGHGLEAGDSGDCSAYWACSPLNFSVECAVVGDHARCTCRVDGLVSSVVDAPKDIRCFSAEAADACGFSF